MPECDRVMSVERHGQACRRLAPGVGARAGGGRPRRHGHEPAGRPWPGPSQQHAGAHLADAPRRRATGAQGQDEGVGEHGDARP